MNLESMRALFVDAVERHKESHDGTRWTDHLLDLRLVEPVTPRSRKLVFENGVTVSFRVKEQTVLMTRKGLISLGGGGGMLDDLKAAMAARCPGLRSEVQECYQDGFAYYEVFDVTGGVDEMHEKFVRVMGLLL